jgi:hypothetical protein
MAANPQQVFIVNTLPGIQRDGTDLDSSRFNDGQWVRFQRGKPRKMLGYRRISAQVNGPIRAVNVWSRQALNAINLFSSSGVESVLTNNEGIGSGVYNRTPSGFVSNDNLTWQVDTMYDDAAGAQNTIIVAHGANSLDNIDDGTATSVYWGVANETTALQAIAGIQVSGGIVVANPYLIFYGSDGQVTWSNANEPRNVTTGDAGSDRVTSSKIVKGMPMRGGGQSPAVLLWSLDSVIRMSYIGGNAIFRFDTLSSQSSVLSSNGFIEYDGMFFWVGIDRFLTYNGKIEEVVNTQNLNWFFDNLNFAQRQKVWAMKVPRWGEIWWFFPKGDATECTHAVIYNVREKYWYDVELDRGAGYYSQVFRYPVMTGSTPTASTVGLLLSGVSGIWALGETVTSASGGSGKVYKLVGSDEIYVSEVTGTFDVGSVTGATSGATATITSVEYVDQYELWVHESGLNKVAGDDETAIYSMFETADFGLPTGGFQADSVQGIDRWSRLRRVEPDFNSSGNLNLYVTGKEFAQADNTVSQAYPFDSETVKIDMREQRREVRLKVESNDLNGNYEMGKVIVHIEPGDIRS